MAEKKKTNKIYIRTEADFLGYQGSTPFVEFDENWQQMPLDRTKMTVPREHLMRMMPLAYLAGKLSTLEQKQKISIMMIIILVVSILSLGYTYFNSGSLSKKMDSLASTTSLTELANKTDQNTKLLEEISERIGGINNRIPIVGG